MNTPHIRQLIAQIAQLEAELQTALHNQESKMFFQIKGRRVEFEQSVRSAHRRLKMGFVRWLVVDRPINLITGPIIYSMLLPLIMTDLCVSFYQASCFPIYGIRKVARSDYIVMDRQNLEFLNFFQKLHCNYCAYGSGLIAYVGEIIARTEQYFCPIKHARKIIGTHARYRNFLEFGDGEDYDAKLEQFRRELADEKPDDREDGV